MEEKKKKKDEHIEKEMNLQAEVYTILDEVFNHSSHLFSKFANPITRDGRVKEEIGLVDFQMRVGSQK